MTDLMQVSITLFNSKLNFIKSSSEFRYLAKYRLIYI